MNEKGSFQGRSHSEQQNDALFELLEPTVLAQNLYLEDVHLHQAGSHRTLQVVVDLPQNESGSLSLDAISQLSRALSTVLDNADDDDRPYHLEVSSPGVTRPLTQPRHWHRALGRMITVTFPKPEHKDDVVGRLLRYADGIASLRPEITVKKGMKPQLGDPVNIDTTAIKRAIVNVEFSKLPDEADEPAGSKATDQVKSGRGSGRKRARRAQKGRGRDGH